MPDISAGLRHRTTQAAAFGLLSSVVVALLGSLLFAGPVGAEVASSAGGAPVGLGTPAAGDAGDTKGVDMLLVLGAGAAHADQTASVSNDGTAVANTGGNVAVGNASDNDATSDQDADAGL